MNTPHLVYSAASLKNNPDLTEARRVLDIEASALTALSRTLGQEFISALDLFFATKGRVIVTGVGKSGHVARKIAATLSSTGTSSLFVHGAEASHGDLGMIEEEDVILALSNSGETIELAHIVNFSKRYKIPLVSMTSGAESTLAQASTVVLALPKVREACPMELAPTTSTTLMMALGDAIASTLLKRKGFSAKDFKVFHPSGTLGRKLRHVQDGMAVGELMPLVQQGTSMKEGLLEMSSKGFGCVGVLAHDGSLAGMITDGDLRRHMGEKLLEYTVDEVMTPLPTVISPQTLMTEALTIMNDKKITALFVGEAGQTSPIGLLHIHECLRQI